MLVVHFNVLSWQKEKDAIPMLVSQSCYYFFFVIVLVLQNPKNVTC